MKRVILVLAVLLLSACATRGSHEYYGSLGELIGASDRIVAVEHSSEYDAIDVEAQKSLIPEAVVYRVLDLNFAQRERFLKIIESLDAKSQNASPACVFKPHHTIRFYKGSELRSTMAVCFECEVIRWDGSLVPPPMSIYAGLRSFFRELGLEPERDWYELARKIIQKREKQPYEGKSNLTINLDPRKRASYSSRC